MEPSEPIRDEVKGRPPVILFILFSPFIVLLIVLWGVFELIEFIAKMTRRRRLWKRWQRVTPEILEEYKIQSELDKKTSWFYSKKFTVEEQVIIYNHFESLNILNPIV